MGSLVAVDGFSYTVSGVTELSPGSAVIAPTPSTSFLVEGKGVYRGTITLTFAPGTLSHPSFATSVTNVSPAVFTISPAGVVTGFTGGENWLCEGDESDEVQVAGVGPGGPVTAGATVQISGAGQTSLYAS